MAHAVGTLALPMPSIPAGYLPRASEGAAAVNAADMHVRPLGDLIEHEWDGCVCAPTPQLVETDHGDEWIYVHHSLDGRELYE